MTLQELKLYIETVLNKHSSGNSLTPNEYNNLLEANIFSFVKSQILAYRQYVNSGTPVDDTIFTALLIDALQKTSSPSLAGGAFTVASDFLMLDSMWGTYNGNLKEIELVSPQEYGRRIHNTLSKPVAYFPVAYLVGTSCRVYPTNMSSLTVNYISKPVIPKFDYYSDANYNIVYLAASGSRLLTAGEYGSAGQTSGTTVNSLTVELDLPEDTHLKFADYLLSKVGMRDRDVNLYQASENEIAKNP